MCKNKYMNKIILELTPRELEVLKYGLLKEEETLRDSLSKEVVPGTLRNDINMCHRLWAYLDDAVKPKEDALITYQDLFDIVSVAKDQFTDLHFDTHISEQKVEQRYFLHISLANSLLMWLNKNNLLKRNVGFEYTDSSCKFEEQID